MASSRKQEVQRNQRRRVVRIRTAFLCLCESRWSVTLGGPFDSSGPRPTTFQSWKGRPNAHSQHHKRGSRHPEPRTHFKDSFNTDVAKDLRKAALPRNTPLQIIPFQQGVIGRKQKDSKQGPSTCRLAKSPKVLHSKPSEAKLFRGRCNSLHFLRLLQSLCVLSWPPANARSLA